MRFKTFVEDIASNKKLIAGRKDTAAQALFNGFKNTLDEMIKHKIILYRAAANKGKKRMSVDFPPYEDFEIRTAKVIGRVEPRVSLSSDDTLMNIASGWEGFPERRFSAFATQNVQHTAKFAGQSCFVIPADSTKAFGWMPDDFNESTTRGAVRKNKDKFDGLATAVRWVISESGTVLRAETASEFKNKLMDIAVDNNLIDEIKATVYRHKISKEKTPNLIAYCDSILKRHKELKKLLNDRNFMQADFMDRLYSLMEYIEDKGWSSVKEAFEEVTPEAYGAKLLKSVGEIPQSSEPTEIWFTGDYLLIDPDFDIAHDERATHDMQIDMLKAIRAALN